MTKYIRAGSGLGDSLYLRPIAEHLDLRAGPVVALSNYPDVFLGSGVRVEPFRRDRVDIVAHYTGGKTNPDTTQFEDMCRCAGIETDVSLAFDWSIRNFDLINRVRLLAGGRPVVLVHGGCEPMNRHDDFAIDLLPAQTAFATLLRGAGDAFRVGIGHDQAIYDLPLDLNLNRQTSIADVLDLARNCDAIVAQCSFAIPLAEVFDKPLLAVWSAQQPTSRTPYIRSITPSKILHKKIISTYVMDDNLEFNLYEAGYRFVAQLSTATICAS